MKKLSHLSTFVLLTIILTLFSSCESWFGGNGCDDTKMPYISKTFLISLKINYLDNQPFEGKVEYSIYKKNCEGEESGFLDVICTSDGNGTFNANDEPLYSYYNKVDRVYLGFTAHYEVVFPTGGTSNKTKTISKQFYYINAESASDENDEIIETYTMTIPTNSDGTEPK